MAKVVVEFDTDDTRAIIDFNRMTLALLKKYQKNKDKKKKVGKKAV